MVFVLPCYLLADGSHARPQQSDSLYTFCFTLSRRRCDTMSERAARTFGLVVLFSFVLLSLSSA